MSDRQNRKSFRIGMQGKMLIRILAVFLAVFLVSTVFTVFIFQSTLRTNARALAKESAYHTASKVEQQIFNGMVTVENFSEILKSYEAFPREQRRNIINQMLKRTLLENKIFLSSWITAEPNSFDGMDSTLKNTPGNNETGRFTSTWYRDNDTIRLTMAAESELLTADYYLLPKKHKKPILMDPYFYSYPTQNGKSDASKPFWETSMIYPVIRNGEYIAEVGVDIDLTDIQKIVESANVMGDGYAALVSFNGTYAAHRDTNFIGKSITNIKGTILSNRIASLQAIQEGKEFILNDWEASLKTWTIRIYVPISLNDTPTPWSLVVTIPLSKLNHQAGGLLLVSLLSFLVTFILMALMIVFVARSIVRPLRDVSGALGSIAAGGGDLTRQIVIHSNDEIGDLAANFNLFLRNLNDDIVKVSKTAREVNGLSTEAEKVVSTEVKQDLSKIDSAVRHIDEKTGSAASGIEQLASTVEEIVRNIDSISGNIMRQSSAVEESASSIEEMVRNIENTASMTNQTRDLSLRLSSVAKDGGDAVGKALGSIREVSEYSQQILKMLSLISTVAKQTNLLAMNAAIEAAHAGEAGKGFAIVADEIRRLAEDTNRNAREIGDVVGSIVSRIGDSVALSEKAGDGLRSIMDFAGENSQVVERLSVTMEEQSAGAKEVLRAIQDLVSITEEVQTSIAEQKNATDEFSGAIKGIRDLTVENRSEIRSHFESLEKLIARIENIRGMVQKNLELSNSLRTLMDKFVTKEREPEKTGLKLVD